MNTNLSEKRGGGKSNEVPPKMVPEVLEASSSAKYDVTIIVNEQRFQCLKEELSYHSMYFQRMFNSNFKEKDEKEVELREVVESEPFDMFLKVVSGEGVVTDVTVEELLHLADYLESAVLEEKCMLHLANETGFSLKSNSKWLKHSSFSFIEDAYDLNEVVPKDLESFCNTTKNIVMQKSFELLGIRKSPATPLSEDPDQVFEHKVNQLIDQVEVQNYHGEILLNQAILLFNHLGMESYLRETDEAARDTINGDPLIKELLYQQQEAHDQKERNFIEAQIQVLKMKHIYTREQSPEFWLDPSIQGRITSSILLKLRARAAFLNRDKRSRSRSQKLLLGNREIDEIYRNITAEVMEQNLEERPRNVNDSAIWLERIIKLNERMGNALRTDPSQELIRRPMPDGIRYVSNKASFRLIDEFVSNARDLYYTTFWEIEPEQNGVGDIDRNVGAQNPQEQDQEGN